MNRCEEVQEGLMFNVASAAEPEVRTHLRGCRQCAGFFEDLCALEDLTREMASSHDAPSGFGQSVMSGLPRARWVRSLAAHAVIPVLLATTVLVVGVMNSPEDSVSSESAVVGALDDSLAPADGEAGPGYVDVVIEDPVRGEVIVRVPAVIQFQRTPQGQDFYVHKVSY